MPPVKEFMAAIINTPCPVIEAVAKYIQMSFEIPINIERKSINRMK